MQFSAKILPNNRFLPQIQGLTVADLRGGGARDACPPPGPKFFQFHAVFGEIWQNRMLAPPWGVGTPSSGKSWIRHWLVSPVWEILDPREQSIRMMSLPVWYHVLAGFFLSSGQGGEWGLPPGTPWYWHLVVATAAVGTHPTGMHSWFVIQL